MILIDTGDPIRVARSTNYPDAIYVLIYIEISRQITFINDYIFQIFIKSIWREVTLKNVLLLNKTFLKQLTKTF